MDLWAIARFDLGLSFEEFEELTPAMFRALCKRRNLKIKYERFANAQTAAAVYNVNRHKTDDPMITAMDFVREDEKQEARERLLDAKRFCRKVVGNLPMTTPREKYLDVRKKAIADLNRDGFANAEEIFNEAWPHLKPEGDECQK